MNQIAPVTFRSDPYFHDIIREMEAIGAPSANPEMARRQFVKLAGFAGAGLVLGFAMGAGTTRANAAAAAGDAVLNAYVRIAPTGEIIL